jgi:hypothetical protein
MEDFVFVHDLTVPSETTEGEFKTSEQLTRITAKSVDDAQRKLVGSNKGYVSNITLLTQPLGGWRTYSAQESGNGRHNGHGLITIDVVPAPWEKLTSDLRKATATLSAESVRYLVNCYYIVQNYRIRFSNQITALEKAGEPRDLIMWMHKQVEGLENEIKKALDSYSLSHEVGQWMRSLLGVGPVIASGYLAHIDISRAPTAGHLWSYSGVAVGQVWDKHEKRPWNASLKRLNFLLGESFVKVQNNDSDFYGHIFADRKRLETEGNGYKFYADQAQNVLATKKISEEKEKYVKDAEGKMVKTATARYWYEQGMLPPAHIHSRARRYSVKHFLSDLQQVWWQIEYHEPAPKPFVIEHLGHAHLRPIPNWPMEGKFHAMHDEEIVQATPDTWTEPSLGEMHRLLPMQPLYLTLQTQLFEFKAALERLEAKQLPSPTTEDALQVLQGYVPEAVMPTLAERIARFKSTSQHIITASQATGELQ